MKKFFNWVLANGCFLSVFIVGIILDKYGFILFGNVLSTIYFFLAALIFILLLASDAIIEFHPDPKKAKKSVTDLEETILDRPLWFKILDPAYDISMIIFFAYFSFYYSLVFYTLGSVILIFNKFLVSKDK